MDMNGTRNVYGCKILKLKGPCYFSLDLTFFCLLKADFRTEKWKHENIRAMGPAGKQLTASSEAIRHHPIPWDSTTHDQTFRASFHLELAMIRINWKSCQILFYIRQTLNEKSNHLSQVSLSQEEWASVSANDDVTNSDWLGPGWKPGLRNRRLGSSR